MTPDQWKLLVSGGGWVGATVGLTALLWGSGLLRKGKSFMSDVFKFDNSKKCTVQNPDIQVKDVSKLSTVASFTDSEDCHVINPHIAEAPTGALNDAYQAFKIFYYSDIHGKMGVPATA